MQFTYEKAGYKADDGSDVWVFVAEADCQEAVKAFMEELRRNFLDSLLSLLTEEKTYSQTMWYLSEDAFAPCHLKPDECFRVSFHMKEHGVIHFKLMYECIKEEDKQ